MRDIQYTWIGRLSMDIDKDVHFLQVNATPIKIPARGFIDIDQIILKVIRKSKSTRIAVLFPLDAVTTYHKLA